MPERDPLIALDAMGGDNAPAETVAGAVEAARDLGVLVMNAGALAQVQAGDRIVLRQCVRKAA